MNRSHTHAEHDCSGGIVYVDAIREMIMRKYDDEKIAAYEGARFARPCPKCAFKRMVRRDFANRWMTWQNWQTRIAFDHLTSQARAWAAKEDDKILLLHGDDDPENCRNGKTHILSAAAHSILSRGKRVTYRNAAELGGAAWDNNIDDLGDYPGVLLLDDLGNEQDNTGTRDIIDRMVNRRYRARLTTVITSRYSETTMTAKYRRLAGSLAACTLIRWVVEPWTD